MNNFKYILEKYNGAKSRFKCPSCRNDKRTFVRYVDTETNEYLSENVGRCNRATSCGYHLKPSQYFPITTKSYNYIKPKAVAVQKPTSFIPVEIFKASLKNYNENNFATFLTKLFGTEVTNQLIEKYCIGTSKHWSNSTVFWQVDEDTNVRTGKLMLYSPSTGKRIKKPYDYITWVHSALKLKEFNLKQSLFGTHLLIDKTKPIAITESEKTAIISSVYLPNYIWLATGGLSNLNAEKCKILKGRNVVLFPDLKCFDTWNTKAKELSQLTGIKFRVSDLLERKATDADKQQGYDLADYLIQFDYKDFTKPVSSVVSVDSVAPKIKDFSHVVPFEQTIKVQPQNWSNDIAELETYFASIALPTTPIKVDQCTTITDCYLFVNSHLATVKYNNGKLTYLPYLNRLQELKQALTTNIN